MVVAHWKAEHEECQGLDVFFIFPSASVEVDDGYILCSCANFAANPSQWKGSALCIGTDAKMSTMAKGWSVATMGFLAKDGLRKTTISRSANGRDIQCKADKCLAHSETTYVPARLASDFCRVWGAAVQCEPADVAMQVVQVHKDGAASIESSHQQVFTASRSVDDFAHLLRMLRPKLQAKMRGTVSVPTGASKVQQTTLRHHDPLTIFCGMYQLWTCSWLYGKPWKSMSDMCGSNPKQRTICKRWFTFHWCQAFHHHFEEGHKRAQKLMSQLLVGGQDCTARCLG